MQDFPAARSTAAASRVPPPFASTVTQGGGWARMQGMQRRRCTVAAAAAPRCTFTAFTEDGRGRTLHPPERRRPRSEPRVLPVVVLVLVGGEGGGGLLAGFLPLHPPSFSVAAPLCSLPLTREKVHKEAGEGRGMHLCCSCCNQTPSNFFPSLAPFLPFPSLPSPLLWLRVCVLLHAPLLSALCSSCCSKLLRHYNLPLHYSAGETPLQNFPLHSSLQIQLYLRFP